jgi:hypothetical protein
LVLKSPVEVLDKEIELKLLADRQQLIARSCSYEGSRIGKEDL